MDIEQQLTRDESTQPLSRHDRRELRRAELKQNQRAFERRRGIRRVLTWVAALAVLVGLGWGMVKLASQVPAATDGAGLAVPVGEGENSKGPADAPVTLVEYSDFQCPACAAYQPLIQSAMESPELLGRVRLVYRHFPLTNIHPNAQQAALATQAAALQGKFWEFHDKLFEEQSLWSKMSGTGAGEKFAEYAAALGLDVERWRKDSAGGPVEDKVAADVAGANAARVNSTPTFFINGTRMTSPTSADDFTQQIIRALNATP